MTGRASAQNTVTFEDLTAKLDRWKVGADNPRLRAAVTLLQEHESWLRRGDFVRNCVDAYPAPSDEPDSPGWARVNWNQVEEFLEDQPRASTSELAVLRFAAELARDAFDWSAMGPAHKAMLLRAVTTVLGDEEEPRGVDLGDFGRDIAARVRSAVANHGGRPNPAWSHGEQIAVALVLSDRDFLASVGLTPSAAVARVQGDLIFTTRSNIHDWLAAVRAAAGV